MWSRSVAMRFNAVLSRTTTQSAQLVKRRNVKSELYGWTTTSLEIFDLDINIIVQWWQNKAFDLNLYTWFRLDLGTHCMFAPVFSGTDQKGVPWRMIPFLNQYHQQSNGTKQIPLNYHCPLLHGRWYQILLLVTFHLD